MRRILTALLFLGSSLSAETAKAGIYLPKKVGRLGDQLLYVAEGAWLARKYNIPLYSTPFEYSDCFSFSQILTKPDSTILRSSHTKKIYDDKSISATPLVPTLYIPTFGVPYKEERLMGAVCYASNYNIDWKDPGYQEELKALFQPLIPINYVQVPKGRYSVALHHRQGGSFDNARVVGLIPGKFTSLSWALQKVKEIYKKVGQKPLYVHLFTDDLDPEGLVQKLRIETKEPNIKWGITKDNTTQEAIFSDLFSMMRFDFLITPQSSFSYMAWLLGDHILTYRQGVTVLQSNRLIVKTEHCIPGKRSLHPDQP